MFLFNFSQNRLFIKEELRTTELLDVPVKFQSKSTPDQARSAYHGAAAVFVKFQSKNSRIYLTVVCVPFIKLLRVFVKI